MSSQNTASRFSGPPALGRGWFEYVVAVLVKLSQPLEHTLNSLNEPS